MSDKIDVLKDTKAIITITTKASVDEKDPKAYKYDTEASVELDPPYDNEDSEAVHPAGNIAIKMIKEVFGDQVEPDDMGGPAVNEGSPA